MAITIEQTLKDLNPAYNEIPLVVSSTNVAESGFKFIFDFYIDAVKVSRSRVSAEPINGYGFIDLSGVLENFVNIGEFDYTLDEGIIAMPTEAIEFTIKIGEEYLVAGVRTQYVDLTTTTEHLTSESLTNLEMLTHLGDNYSEFLTDKPAASNITDLYGEGFNTIFLESGSTFDHVKIRTFLGGVLQDTYEVTNPDGSSDTAYRVATGVDTINRINPGSIVGTPTQPIIDSSIDAYTVTAVMDLVEVSTLIYAIEDRCEEQQSSRLHFLNKYGGFDHFDFKLLGESKANINRKTMTRAVDRLQTSGEYTRTSTDRGKTAYNATYNRMALLNSNWITEDESNWLIEMLSSPVTYIENNGVIESCVITDTNYDFKTEQADQLFKISVNIEYSLMENRQRG